LSLAGKVLLAPVLRDAALFQLRALLGLTVEDASAALARTDRNHQGLYGVQWRSQELN
jgi:hypothetical protein